MTEFAVKYRFSDPLSTDNWLIWKSGPTASISVTACSIPRLTT